MATKVKQTCICIVCREQFTNITDHMLHYMRAHDDGYKEHKDRRRQSIHCRACSAEILPPAKECVCGWQDPSIRNNQEETK